MLISNLDTIVRRGLLEDGLPIHWYSEFLYHGASCIRELSFDSLQIINAANLPVGDYGEINWPDDYVDDVSVCIPISGELSALPKQDWITPLRIHDTTSGAFVPYTTTPSTDEADNTFFGFPGAWSYYWQVNDFGEPTGGFYGANGGTRQGYKVIRERRQLQLTDNFIGSNVVLLYISDGQNADSASQVDVMAFAVIRAYTEWKRSPNRDNENSPEGRTFYNQRRLFRARKNNLTLTDIRNVYRTHYHATLKS